MCSTSTNRYFSITETNSNRDPLTFAYLFLFFVFFFFGFDDLARSTRTDAKKRIKAPAKKNK